MSESAYWKRRNSHVRPTQRESDLQRTILGYLDLKRIFHFRSNTGAIKFSRPDGKGRFVRFGVRGQADILCCIKGQFVAIECKAEDGEQTLAQKEWQAGLERAGGFYILARKLEDVTEVLEAPDRSRRSSMSDTPKSFRELAREMRQSRAHTGASENADRYRGFDAGQLRAAEYVERLADEWERRMDSVAQKGGTYFGSAFIIHHMLGAKERR